MRPVGDSTRSSAYIFCGKSWHLVARNVFESTKNHPDPILHVVWYIYCPTCFPFITGASTRWIILTQPSFLIVFGQQKRPPPTSLSRFKTKVMARFTFFLRGAIWAMNKQKNTCWRFCGLKGNPGTALGYSPNTTRIFLWIMSTSPPRDMFYEYSDLKVSCFLPFGKSPSENPLGFLEYEPLIYQPTNLPTNQPINLPNPKDLNLWPKKNTNDLGETIKNPKRLSFSRLIRGPDMDLVGSVLVAVTWRLFDARMARHGGWQLATVVSRLWHCGRCAYFS